MKIKNFLKEHSMYMLILALAECLLSIVATISFVYTDTLSYSESQVIQTLGIEKLLESIYTSTWWALILFLLFFIALFAVMTIIYKKMEYMAFSIGCWVEMFILAINLNNPIKDTIINMVIFIPIFILNIIAYRNEKMKIVQKEEIINKVEIKEESKKVPSKKTVTKKSTNKNTKKKTSK